MRNGPFIYFGYFLRLNSAPVAFALLAAVCAVQSAGAYGAFASGQERHADTGELANVIVGGLAVNRRTIGAAAGAAITHCESNVLDNTRTLTCRHHNRETFQNTCGAIDYFGGNNIATATAPTADAAKLAVCLKLRSMEMCGRFVEQIDASCDTTCEFGQRLVPASADRMADGYLNDCAQCGNNEISNRTECTACDAGMSPNFEKSGCLPECGMNATRSSSDACVCDSGFERAGANCVEECGAGKQRVGENCLDKCAANQIRGDNDACRAAEKNDCPADGMIPIPANGMKNCTPCPAGTLEHDNGLECREREAGDCAAETPVFNEGDKTCRALTASDCERNEILYGETGGVRFCAPPLSYAAGYTPSHCEREWKVLTAVQVQEKSVRETCEIPVRVESNFAPSALSGVRPLRAVGAEDGETYAACILSEHAGFSGGRTIPRCDDENLFAARGLPEMPENFNAGNGDRITVASSGVFFNGEKLAQFAPPSNGGGGGADKGGIAIATGAAVFIGLLAYGAWDGNPNAFSFSPQTSFSHNNGRTSYSYGSRLDFEQDKLSAYWSATRAHGVLEENWLYATGIEYGKDVWSANFDSVHTGDETEINFGISAEWKAGAWNWRSGINADYRTNGIENDFSAFWRNSLTVEFGGGWRLMPSADFRWQSGGKILDGGDFRIDLRREF